MDEKKMKVYIVDDEYPIVERIQKSVDWESYDFEVVGYSTSAVEAYQYMMKHPVDLLLTDISMPELSGLELIKAVKEKKPEILVIVISAYDKFAYVKEAYSYGIINYCLKPIDMSELSECLNHARMTFDERQINYYSNDVRVFRNSTLLKLLYGDYDVLKFEEQSRLAGIDLSAGGWQVVLMDISILEETQKVALLKYYRENESDKYYCFLDVNMNLVFLLYGDTVSEEAWKVRKLLKNSMDISENFICVGEVLQGYRQLAVSYRRCLDFLNAAYIFHSRTVQERKYSGEKYRYEALDTELSSLRGALNIYDAAGMQDVIRKIIQKCRTEEEKKTECINLAIFMIKNTRIDRENQEAVIQIDCLDSLNSSEKMLLWLESFGRKLVRAKEQADGNLHPFVKNVLHEINTRYTDNNFSVNELAEKLGVSASYLGTLFRQQTGVLINDCLTKRRLEKALELLEDSSTTMKEIAAACGFASQNYLNRVFKQKYGVTLTEYRRKLVV